MYFYSHQLTQSMTSWFDRNSTFYVLHCSILKLSVLIFYTFLLHAKQYNVEFMSNHNIIFWVNWCKNECFWKRTTCKIMVPYTSLSWVSAERSWEGVPTCTGPSTFSFSPKDEHIGRHRCPYMRVLQIEVVKDLVIPGELC